jgi:hypothetical protein
MLFTDIIFLKFVKTEKIASLLYASEFGGRVTSWKFQSKKATFKDKNWKNQILYQYWKI